MSKISKIDRNRQMSAGLQKNHSAKDTVLVDGVAIKVTDLLATLKAPVDAADATASAQAARHQAVVAEQAANEAADEAFQGLKGYFTSIYKKTPETLSDYGLSLTVPRKPSAATKAAAAAKREATRVARGIKGKRQRAAITAPVAVTAAQDTPPAATPQTAPQPAVKQ